MHGLPPALNLNVMTRPFRTSIRANAGLTAIDSLSFARTDDFISTMHPS